MTLLPRTLLVTLLPRTLLPRTLLPSQACYEMNPAEKPTMVTWYEKQRLGDLPQRAAERFGAREALVFEDRRYTFLQVAAEVDRLARAFIAQGIAPGDHVGIWWMNSPEWVFAMYALARIGAVQVPINSRFRGEDAAYVLQHADCKLLLMHDVSGPIDYLRLLRQQIPAATQNAAGAKEKQEVEHPDYPHLQHLVVLSQKEHPGTLRFSDLLRRAPEVSTETLHQRAASVDPDATICLFYTSGTTGFPKGVMHAHNLIRLVEERGSRLNVTPADVILNYLPLFHLFGYSEGALLSLLTGAKQVLTEQFDAHACLDLVAAEKVSMMNGFDTHLRALVEAQKERPRDVSSLRTGLFAAGMHSSVGIMREALQVLAPLRMATGYGMSEMGVGSLLSGLDSSEEQCCQTSGYPALGFQVRIWDVERQCEQELGQPGELLFKGFGLMQGYYKRPEDTAACYDAEGWFHTGDMALLRPDGYVRFLGRYKDMLKVGGENMDPMEVEALLQRHEAVEEVAVVSYPDAKLSEVPWAFVVPRGADGPSEAELIAHCRGRLASFKIPRRVIFCESLPMTATGKVQKAKLRQQALELPLSAGPDPAAKDPAAKAPRQNPSDKAPAAKAPATMPPRKAGVPGMVRHG